MKIIVKSSDTQKEVELDTDKKYRLIYENCVYIVVLKLQQYSDSEGYDVYEHYGYVFVIDKVESYPYSKPPNIGSDIGTAPDFCDKVIEVRE